MESKIETLNKFLVAANTRGLIIMNPPLNLSHDDALLLAAYLVSMAEPLASNTFEEVLQAVQHENN